MAIVAPADIHQSRSYIGHRSLFYNFFNMKTAAFFCLLLLLGCTSTKLTSSWTSPQAGNYAYKKILVVSIIHHNDTTIGRKMENHLVNDLKSIGHDAVGYRQLFQKEELKDMRYDSVRKKLIDKGIDGVITISLMATEKESVYVKDKGNIDPGAFPLGSFWQSPATVKQEIGKPGYYVEATTYYWESSLYDVASIELLYNSKSTAFEVTSMESLAHKYGKMIVKDLQKKFVLSGQQRSTQAFAIRQWLALQLLKTTSPLQNFIQTITLRDF